MYSSNTSPAQAQDEDIYPRRLRQLLGRGWVTVHGPEFRKKPFSWQKCLSGVGGSLTRFAPGAAAVPRPADPSPTPAGVKLAAGGGTGAPGRLGAPARVPRQKRNAEATAVRRKGCGDGVSFFWAGDTPPHTHTPLLLDPPGLSKILPILLGRLTATLSLSGDVSEK